MPLTIVALAALLAVKSVTLVRAAAGDAGAQRRCGRARCAGTASRGDGPQNYKAAGSPPPTQASGAPRRVARPPGRPNGTPPWPGAVGQRPPSVPCCSICASAASELDARDAALTAREAMLAAAGARLEPASANSTRCKSKLEGLEQAPQAARGGELGGPGEALREHEAARRGDDLQRPRPAGAAAGGGPHEGSEGGAGAGGDAARKAREVTTKLAALRTKAAAVTQSN